MRDYIYLAEGKINRYYDQTPAAKRRPVEDTIGLNTMVKGERRVGPRPQPTTHEKLEEVLAVLQEADEIGDPRSNKPYIKGPLTMKWASYGSLDFSPLTFWGYASDDLYLGLIGSQYNVADEKREGNVHSHSNTPAFMAWVRQRMGEELPPIPWPNAEEDARMLESDDISGATQLAIDKLPGSVNRYDFVAKVLSPPVDSPVSSKPRVVLATPLYVSLD